MKEGEQNSVTPEDARKEGIPLRVLIIEDSEDDAMLILRQLRKGGYKPVWKRVETADELSEAVDAGQWDIVLSDFNLPDFDGRAALDLLKDKDIDLPFIVISGILVEEMAVDILKAGAGDYIKKGNWSRLIPAIERGMREAESRRERRRAQKAQKEAENRYRSLFENAVEGIFRSTPQGRFVSVNPALAHIFGYDSPQDLMCGVTDIRKQLYVDPASREKLLSELKAKGTVSGFETQHYCRDGSTIWVSIHARAVFGEDGNLEFLEGMLTDITARKRAEKDKARLEEQLRHSQKMEAVGTLAGGIAHDFNNLLQAISGNVEILLMKKDLDDPEYAYLADIYSAARRAASLVNHLLTFSRKTGVRFQPIDLNSVIENTLKLLKRTIPRMVSIETRLAPDIRDIHADPIQMEQILMNLVSNSYAAMPLGGNLTIETENLSLSVADMSEYLDLEPGEYVLFRVKDTGIGMDENTLSHIFEPFFTTKGVGKGTGLGLSTVYGIVKGHGGHVSCSSRPGQGATFEIYLPAYPSEDSAMQESGASQSEVQGGTETILIVDDERFLLDLCQEALSGYGYKVLLAESGEEALEIYERESGKIELVILDLGMPGMGGEKCLQELWALNHSTKVIVASGYASHMLTELPKGTGTLDFLSKPYRLDDLLGKVREMLDGC